MAQRMPSAQWETWTPDRARDAIAAQEEFGQFSNRKFRPYIVNSYAAEMAAGRWKWENGESLIFNGRRCLDGQHRLLAIVKSGVTMNLLTVRDVPESVMPTIDSGLSRTPGDVFRAANPALVGGYYNAVAAAARIACVYTKFRDISTSPELQPTRQDLVEFVGKYPGIVESVRWNHQKENKWCRPKITAAWHFLCGVRHPIERDAFFTDLALGANLRQHQPVLTLRQRLIEDKGSRAKLPSNVLSAFFVKAWNAELHGQPLKLLRWRSDEAFPLLLGDEYF